MLLKEIFDLISRIPAELLDNEPIEDIGVYDTSVEIWFSEQSLPGFVINCDGTIKLIGDDGKQLEKCLDELKLGGDCYGEP